jgi:carboxymethylenebutenolidase
MNLISRLLLFLLTVGFLGTLGCTYSTNAGVSSNADSGISEAAGTTCSEIEHGLSASENISGSGTADCAAQIKTSKVNITSENRTYPAYTAAPAAEGNYPAIVLIHSFKGFEPGYGEMVDRMAADGYVVIAPFWQTYSNAPSDSEVEALVRKSVAYLDKRENVDSERLGLTGFCAGGRYTMLFLPRIKEFKTGVAWYGFPYTGGTEIQPDKPASLIDQLDVPMLMIHGSRDQASNISNIYRYAGELDAANKYFELKVYQGEPHGFMITGSGELSESFVAQDAYKQMIGFFDRTLKNS